MPPVFRDDPYPGFNFLVDFGADPATVAAGFMECSAIESSIDVIEYRNGNERSSASRKLAGRQRVGDVTLKRGVIGSADLFEWLQASASGGAGAVRDVRIQLLDESRSTVMTWNLSRARIVHHSIGPLNALGNDVAIEEITLAYERLDID